MLRPRCVLLEIEIIKNWATEAPRIKLEPEPAVEVFFFSNELRVAARTRIHEALVDSFRCRRLRGMRSHVLRETRDAR